MARKSISKGTRFDIFKRDNFTCQYCGAQPPDTVLHVDHITPVASGGDNDPMNLVTSCDACNLGKSTKRLDDAPRPDADLAWLEVQQELAELRRYQRAKIERDSVAGEVIKLLQRTWLASSQLDWAPSDATIKNMMAKHSPEEIEQAFVIVGPKVAGGYVSDKGSDWLKYIYGVLKNLES